MGNQIPLDSKIVYIYQTNSIQIVFNELKGKRNFNSPQDPQKIIADYQAWSKSVNIKDVKTECFLQGLPLKYKYRLVQKHNEKIRDLKNLESHIKDSQKIELLQQNLKKDDKMDFQNLSTLLILLQGEPQESIIWKEFIKRKGVEIIMKILDSEEQKSRKTNSFKYLTIGLQILCEMCNKKLGNNIQSEQSVDILFRCIHPLQVENTIYALNIIGGDNGLIVNKNWSVDLIRSGIEHLQYLYQYNYKYESLLAILYESENIVMTLNILLFIQNLLVSTSNDQIRDEIIQDIKNTLVSPDKDVFKVLNSIDRRIRNKKYSIHSSTYQGIIKKIQSYKHPLVYPKSSINQQLILIDLLDDTNNFIQQQSQIKTPHNHQIQKTQKIYLDTMDDDLFAQYEDTVMVLIITISKLLTNQSTNSQNYDYFDNKNQTDLLGIEQFYSTSKTVDATQQMKYALQNLIKQLVEQPFDIHTVNLINHFNSILQKIQNNPKSAGAAVNALQNAGQLTEENIKLQEIIQQKDQEIQNLIHKKNEIIQSQKNSDNQGSSSKEKPIEQKQGGGPSLPMPPPPINLSNQGKGLSIGLPPPPPMFGNQQNIQKKKRPNPSCKMRNFMWNAISSIHTKGTIWEEINDEEVKIDGQQIEQDYKKIEESQNQSTQKQQKIQVQLVSLISKERSQNYELILQKLKISTVILVDSLLTCDFSVLTYEVLNSLDQINPKEEDIKVVSQYQDDVKLLGIPEQYLIQMIKIPLFKERIKALIFTLSYKEQLEDIQKKANNLIKAFEHVEGDSKFKIILTNVLAYGNYINAQNEMRGGANGFKIDAIEKALEFKNNTNTSNLLVDCLQGVYEINDETIDQYDFDLTKIQTIQKIIAKQQMGELSQIKLNYLNLRKVIETQSTNELDKIKETLEPHDIIIKTLISQTDALLITCEQKCIFLIKQYAENNEPQENFADKLYRIKKSILRGLRKLLDNSKTMSQRDSEVSQRDSVNPNEQQPTFLEQKVAFTMRIKSLSEIKQEQERVRKQIFIQNVFNQMLNE